MATPKLPAQARGTLCAVQSLQISGNSSSRDRLAAGRRAWVSIRRFPERVRRCRPPLWVHVCLFVCLSVCLSVCLFCAAVAVAAHTTTRDGICARARNQVGGAQVAQCRSLAARGARSPLREDDAERHVRASERLELRLGRRKREADDAAAVGAAVQLLVRRTAVLEELERLPPPPPRLGSPRRGVQRRQP